MWLYREKAFTEDDIEDSFGFVYLIENLTTGKKYIGKKFFTKAKRKQVKGKVKRIRTSSDWEAYWGSNKVLQEEVKTLGEDKYRREILHLCKTKSECAYMETFEIFVRGALIKEEYYNEWCSCKITKAHLINNKNITERLKDVDPSRLFT
jgi:hypothetical protein